MTFGEMQKWTSRLNQIKKVRKTWIRQLRLENMLNDVILAYGDNEGVLLDKYAQALGKAVVEEMEG